MSVSIIGDIDEAKFLCVQLYFGLEDADVFATKSSYESDKSGLYFPLKICGQDATPESKKELFLCVQRWLDMRFRTEKAQRIETIEFVEKSIVEYLQPRTDGTQ